ALCPAGPGQLPLRPGGPALRGPGAPDQRAELCRLEHRQGPQGPEGRRREPHRAGGPGQVSRAAVAGQAWAGPHLRARACVCVRVCAARPFQRTVTMHKDSTGHVGFVYKSGKICSLVKDSSAARNGLLTEHYLCEINGQNVIGLKDSQIKDILSTSPTAMTVTVMPKFIYEHMIKRMSTGLMRSVMDHSIPEV
ncbi:unnamed protein product, partial [Tetraodon nigroviridis]